MWIADRFTFSSHSMLDFLIKALLAIGILALASQASVPVPGSDVPITLQTVAVLGVGAIFGGARGSLIILIYLIAGGAGLPFFSGGSSGWEKFAGPSGGFLLGFLLSGAIVGWMLRNKPVPAALFLFAAFMIGHLVILVTGIVGLLIVKGSTGIFENVVLPLLPGAVIKSVLLTLITALLYKIPGLNR